MSDTTGHERTDLFGCISGNLRTCQRNHLVVNIRDNSGGFEIRRDSVRRPNMRVALDVDNLRRSSNLAVVAAYRSFHKERDARFVRPDVVIVWPLKPSR